MTTLEKINLVLKERGYELMNITLNPSIETPLMKSLEDELLEVLIGFQYGQCKSANDMLL
jgi:hypothetical protein